jgi:hypothetical protein
MYTEVACAARFLAQTLRLDSARADAFASALAADLERRFAGHWHPTMPHRGSGFRALHYSAATGYSDDSLARAARAAGVDLSSTSLLPPNLTVWIDPNEVSIRVGELGGVFNLPLHNSHSDASEEMYGGAGANSAGLVGRYSGDSSPRSLSPRTSPRISHALPILDAQVF